MDNWVYAGQPLFSERVSMSAQPRVGNEGTNYEIRIPGNRRLLLTAEQVSELLDLLDDVEDAIEHNEFPSPEEAAQAWPGS